MFFEIFWNFAKVAYSWYAVFLLIGVIKGESLTTFTMPDGTIETNFIMKGAVMVLLLVFIASLVVNWFFNSAEDYEEKLNNLSRKPVKPYEEPMEYVQGEVINPDEDRLPIIKGLAGPSRGGAMFSFEYCKNCDRVRRHVMASIGDSSTYRCCSCGIES